MNRFFLALAVFAIVMSASVYSEGLSCRATTEACDTANLNIYEKEVTLLYMTDTSNAHAAAGSSTDAERAGVPSYPVRICCKGVEGLSYNPSDHSSQPIAWLSDNVDAHAGLVQVNPVYRDYKLVLVAPFTNIIASNGGNAGYNAVRMTDADVAASNLNGAFTTCQNEGYETCAFTVSDTADAHVGDCLNYRISLVGNNYAICLKTACSTGPNPPSACRNGKRCLNGVWVTQPDANGDGLQDECCANPPCPGGGGACGPNFGDCPTPPCRGCLKGTVTAIDTGAIVVGADVKAVPVAHSITNPSGMYYMAVPENRIDIVASKAPYHNSVQSANIPGKVETTVNLILGYGFDDCQPDCTRRSNNNICEAQCDGTSGCSYYDAVARDACSGWRKDFKRPYPGGMEIQCCEGAPLTPRILKASTQINATTIARVTRTVWYEGKFVKMVVDVFD